MKLGMSKQNKVTKLAYDKGYRVSDCGTYVKGIKVKKLKLSSQYKRGKLYYSFSLKPDKESNPTRVYVHKLKAYQMFGDKLFISNMVVRHLDDDSTNNSNKNISIGTQLENMMDKKSNILDDDCPF